MLLEPRGLRAGRNLHAGRGRSRRVPLIEPLEGRVVLSSFYTVTGFTDSTNSASQGGAGTQGSPFQMASLRGAVIAANADPGSTIILPAGTYTLSLAGQDDTALAGDLDVKAALTIQGAGSGSTTVQAGTTASNGIDKIFSFNPLGNTIGFPVSLSGLTLRYGKNVSTFASGNNLGGAFDFDAGFGTKYRATATLTMDDVIVDQNQTTIGGKGGGIAILDGATTVITNCKFTNNTASTDATRAVQGGGIFIGSSTQAGSVTISNTIISNNQVTNPNSAPGQTSFSGGGIFDSWTGSTLALHAVTITFNTALGNGGGVAFNNTGTLTIDQASVISNNAAFDSGGGISSVATTSVSNATVANNAAANGGGAFYAFGSNTITVRNSRVVGNTSTSGGGVSDRNTSLTNSVDVTNNWFGSNTAPSSALFGSATAPVNHLVMTFSASPTTVNGGGTSTLTASITTNNASQTGFSVPDGTPVTFAGTNGTVNPPSATTTSSSATSTYTPTAGYSGSASVSGTIDSQTLSASLTINGNQAPVVTTNPTNQTVNAGQTATFTAAASGSPTPTVQWQVSTNGGSSFSNVSGATSTTYIFTASAGDSGNRYRAVFTNSGGTATTTAATLTVNTAPAVTTNPTNQTVNAGQTATFTAAASGSPTPTVQWQVSTDGGSSFNNVPAATSTTYTFTASAGQSGNLYRAVFTNTVGNATTTAASLTVNTAPTVTTNPTNQTVNVGQTATFTAAASGSPTPTVQWQVSTNGGSTFTDVAGATSATYSFTASLGQNGNQYRAVFTNTAGTATSSAATLTVAQASVTSAGVMWGTAGSSALTTAGDGLRLLPAGRTNDIPWNGINRIPITLSGAASLSASDVTVTGLNVANYGPVTISGSGASYTITLAQPINAADRVTITLSNAAVTTYTRRLDVLPGDVNDDTLVNTSDGVIIRNSYSGITVTVPVAFLDVNGDGVVDVNDFNLARQKIGTRLP